MKKHEENLERHFTMAIDKIVELSIFTLSDTDKKQRSITFKLNGYSLKTGHHFFQPFFTSPSGYKIRFFVYPKGDGAGEGTHLSVFWEVLHGPYDDMLEWPFKVTFTVELLNQLADRDHYERSIEFDGSNDHCRAGGNGYGFIRFIELSKLSHNVRDNIQYLKDDSLYFRVTTSVPSIVA